MSRNPLHADGCWFKDEGGRVVILRGVNVAGNSKIPPFVPFSDTTRLDPVKEWGMNVIRLVLIWEAIEPEPGKYNEDYIDAMEALVSAAGERGIYVILDMHQDMFSRYLNGGCGDGAPSWAIDPSIPQDAPANDERCIDWVNGLNDKNVLRAFDSFYANVNGVRDHYISMWAHIARRFGDHPAVIGYDLMNEPIGDEVSQIAPLYEDAGAAIRGFDPDGILFVEPSIFTSFGAIYSQLPPLSLANYAYAPHFYSASLLISNIFSTAEADKSFADFNSKVEELGGVPLLLGEFGMYPEKARVSEYIDDIYRRLDDCFYGGTQWNYCPGWDSTKLDGWNRENYSIIDDRGNIRQNFRVRACAQRVAGIPKKLEVSDKRVRLEWENQPELAAPTLLYVPVDIMFNGSQFDIIEGASVHCELENRYLTCTASGRGTRTVEVKAR